jgi:hypothetical protein
VHLYHNTIQTQVLNRSPVVALLPQIILHDVGRDRADDAGDADDESAITWRNSATSSPQQIALLLLHQTPARAAPSG